MYVVSICLFVPFCVLCMYVCLISLCVFFVSVGVDCCSYVCRCFVMSLVSSVVVSFLR